MNRKFRLAALLLIATFTLNASFPPSKGYSQEQDKIDKAVTLYQHDNFEEALALLKELRAGDGQSSTIAYYLGLTFKKMQNFVEARSALEAAAALSPPVDNAIPELIDVLYQIDEIDEAKKWIFRARERSIAPAQVSFLNGVVLLKEGKDVEGSITAFDEAEKLDPALTNSVKYYKGLCYLQLKKLDQAKDVFRKIVIRDPSADLAAYANEYVDAISRAEDAKKPFRLSAGYAIQYDDNVVLQPNDLSLATGIGNAGDWRSTYTLQGEYNYKPIDKFGIKGGYSFYYGKELDLGFYDTMSNDLSLYPSIYLDKATVSFPAHYNHIKVNDKHYLDLVGMGNSNNIMLDTDNMLQIAFLHNRKYYNWSALRDNDERDSREYLWSIGWIYFLAKNYEGFVQARYTMNYEDTKGNNWTYFGNRLTIASVLPIMKNAKWSLVGDYYRQDFTKINSTYEKVRHDDIISVSNMLAFKIFKGCEIQVQHMFVNDAANIGIFQYKRNVYSAGIKCDF